MKYFLIRHLFGEFIVRADSDEGFRVKFGDSTDWFPITGDEKTTFVQGGMKVIAV